MKKLIALLTAMLLLLSSACAEDSLPDAAGERMLLTAIKSVLDKEGFEYGVDEEYSCCYFGVELDNSEYLGHADLELLAFSDGVTIAASFEQPAPQEHLDEIIRLCNHFNGGIYIGKFYVDSYEDYLYYEVFLPLNPMKPDKELITDNIYLCISVLDFYGEYFGEIIRTGEKAENVYAMWYADTE